MNWHNKKGSAAMNRFGLSSASPLIGMECMKKLKSVKFTDCQFCGARFWSKFCFSRHTTMHRLNLPGSKKFQCRKCHKDFGDIANLLRHQNFHQVSKTNIVNKRSITVEKHVPALPDENAPEPEAKSRSPLNSVSMKVSRAGSRKKKPARTRRPATLQKTTIKSVNSSTAENFDGIDENGEPIRKVRQYIPVLNRVEENQLRQARSWCNICQKYVSRGSFFIHKRRHKGIKPYRCQYCNKGFTLRQEVRIHEYTHTDLRPYKCQTCSKGFNSLRCLRTHRRIHTGERPYCCEICGRGFTQLMHVRDHQRTHDGQKPHKCNQCESSFTTASSLRRHEKNVHHVGDKEYPCNLCDKRFAFAYRLKRHYANVHHDDRNHKCEVCHRAYVSQASLQLHMNVHKGVRPFSCKHCSWSFLRKSHLTRHIKRSHQGEANQNNAQESKSTLDALLTDGIEE